MNTFQKINIIITAFLCAVLVSVAINVTCLDTRAWQNGEIAAVNLNAAAATDLFNSDGSYKAAHTEIVVGAKFNIFGKVWTVVAKNGDKATFWMDTPIGGEEFENWRAIPTEMANNDTQSEYNTYNSAYYNGQWNNKNIGGTYTSGGTSKLRLYLQNNAPSLLSGFSSNDKVLSGPQSGLNVVTGDIITFTGGSTYVRVYYSMANKTANSYGTGQIYLDWRIGQSDKLFVPSSAELEQWGTPVSVRAFTSADFTEVWLRDAAHTVDNEQSNFAVKTLLKTGYTDYAPASNRMGVRPAMNINITASKRCTVTWKNYDGSVLATDSNVAYGTVPVYGGATPTRPASGGKYYTFKGWNKTIVAVTGVDVEYLATYEEFDITHTVIWKQDANTILKEDTNVANGTTPSYSGTAPTKAPTDQFTYTHSGWSPSITVINSNTPQTYTYTATFTAVKRTYTVTWKNYDGSVLATDTGVEYGVVPTYNGATPTKTVTGKTCVFNGWTPSIGSITGDTVYNATFNEAWNTYTIVWKNFDQSVLETDIGILYGATPVYNSATPKREASGIVFTHIGWKILNKGDTIYNTNSSSSPNVSAFPTVDDSMVSGGQITFIAEYTSFEIWTVNWYNFEKVIVGQDFVRQDGSGGYTVTNSRPSPTRQWYTFIGWSKDSEDNTPELTAGPPYVTGSITAHTNFYSCWTATVPTMLTHPTPSLNIQYGDFVESQLLSFSGTAQNGNIEYYMTANGALNVTNDMPLIWSAAVPTAVNAGTYYVWYRVNGASISTPQKLTAVISPRAVDAADITVATIGKQTYKKKPINPNPIVSGKDGVIVTGSWVWTNNDAVGTATGVFHADGNFTVSPANGITATFEIVEGPGLFTEEFLKIAFVIVCVIGIISIICVAIVCSRHRIERSDNSITG